VPSYNPFGGAGNIFGGPTASWAERLGTHNPFKPNAPRDDAYALREEDQGRPALGYYAGQSGLTTPFTDWLTNPTTHRVLWDDYTGLATDRGADYTWQDYLAEFDPRLRWLNRPAEERGETPQSVYALPARFNVRQ
jgi:hypothetical protein